MQPEWQLSALAWLALFAGCGDPGPPISGPTPFAEHPSGLWCDTRYAQRAALLEPSQRVALSRLGAMGYVEALYEASSEFGVVRWDRQRAEDGWNLYCSGHGAEAFLIDMSGTVRRSWAFPYERLPGAPVPHDAYQGAWRRVALSPDGSLLAIYEDLAIVKVDRDSELVWHLPMRAHHDFDVAPDGRVLVFGRAEAPSFGAKPILEDWIVELDADGRALRRVSLLEALRRSPWERLVVEPMRRGGDILHANALELLEEPQRVPHPAFQPGRVLVCFRELDAIAVVDLEDERVHWLQRGPWVGPHDPSVLSDGRILVFDNMGNEGFSRVVAWDVPERRIVWQYAGEPARSFFSVFSGSAQRLPGGNTLVTESYAGRAFEVTPRGEIVWEFISPHRAGQEHELVAVLFDVVRLPPELAPESWH